MRGAGLLLLFCVGICDGLFFYVIKQSQRCFFVEIPTGVHIRATYESPETTDQKRIKYAVYGPRPDDGVQPPPIETGHTEEKGAISLTSTEAGDHWICFRIDTSQFNVPDEKMRMSMEINVGTSEYDYVEIAKKEHLDDLELSILKLRDRVRNLQKQQDFMKRKDVHFRNTSESTNSRVMWVSAAQILVLIISGVLQAQHLRRYFHKKKLV